MKIFILSLNKFGMYKFFVCCFACIIWFGASGQKSDFSNKLFYGGGLGLSLSNVYSNIGASPYLGYKVTDKFGVGLGVIYQYANHKQINLKTHNYGARIFGRQLLFKNIFAHLEYELISYEYLTLNNGEITTRILSKSFFVGGGYATPISKKITLNAVALYNLSFDQTAFPRYYTNPWSIRFGAGIGLF